MLTRFSFHTISTSNRILVLSISASNHICLGGRFGINYPSASLKILKLIELILKNHEGNLSPKFSKPKMRLLVNQHFVLKLIPFNSGKL